MLYCFVSVFALFLASLVCGADPEIASMNVRNMLPQESDVDDHLLHLALIAAVTSSSVKYSANIQALVLLLMCNPAVFTMFCFACILYNTNENSS